MLCGFHSKISSRNNTLHFHFGQNTQYCQTAATHTDTQYTHCDSILYSKASVPYSSFIFTPLCVNVSVWFTKPMLGVWKTTSRACACHQNSVIEKYPHRWQYWDLFCVLLAINYTFFSKIPCGLASKTKVYDDIMVHDTVGWKEFFKIRKWLKSTKREFFFLYVNFNLAYIHVHKSQL